MNNIRSILLVILVATFHDVAAFSIEEADQLLCPAELQVLAADSVLLLNEKLSANRKMGLQKRIGVALATLPYLCRRYAFTRTWNTKKTGQSLSKNVHQLRQYFVKAKFSKLNSHARKLLISVPFPTDRFNVDVVGSTDELAAGALYEAYCRGCHQNNAVSAENPALPLDLMANTQSENEFLSRMLLGVRGTPNIGLSNPLTFAEIGAMRRFLRSVNPESE